VEEPNDLAVAKICSCEIRTLVPITVKASERQILENSQPAMLACLDVIDMKGQRIDGSRQVTILTSVLGALPDLPDKIPSHERWRSCGFLLRASLALDCMTARRFPICK
jgi:hypothetical protein